MTKNIMQAPEEIEIKARELYLKAQGWEAEEKKQYIKASELYQKAKEEYLKFDDERVMRAFKCVENATKNIIRAMDLEFLSIDKKLKDEELKIKATKKKDEVKEKTNFMEKEFYIVPENKVVDDFLIELKKIKQRIHNLYENSQDKQVQLFHACSMHLIWIYKDFENFLYEKGLTDEAIKIYVEMNREKTEKMKYVIKIAEIRYLKKAKFICRIIGRKLWQWFLGFGVLPSHLFYSTLGVIIIWTVLFWKFNLVQYQTDPSIAFPSKEYFGHCLYYSLVSITSLGSEVHVPLGIFGRILQSSEGIIGYGILAGIVAFLTRKIK